MFRCLRLSLACLVLSSFFIAEAQTSLPSAVNFPKNQNAPSPADLENAKRDLIFQLFKYKTNDPGLAQALASQYFSERQKVINGFARGLTLQQIAGLVQTASIVNAGNSQVNLPQQGVVWLLLNQCQITTETLSTSLLNRAQVALVGLGRQEVIGDPAIGEKLLDFLAMDVPPGKSVTISTESFSPFAKAAIVVGVGAFIIVGCGTPAPPPPVACGLRSSGSLAFCPAPPCFNPTCPPALPVCKPKRDEEGRIVSCCCQTAAAPCP